MQQEALKNLQKKVFPYQQCIILIVITDIYMRDIIICFTETDRIIIVEMFDDREDFMYKLFGISTTLQETVEYWNE